MYDTDLGYTSEAAAAVEVRSDINDCGRADRPRSDQTGAREEARVTRMLSVSGLTKEEGQMAMMSQNVIRPSTMGTVGEEDSVVNSRVGHLPDDDGLACRSRRARCKQEGEVRYLRHDGELTDSGRVDDNDDFRLLRIDGCGKAMTDELDRRVKLWRRERWKRRA